ncbi:hypothetical protein NC652_000019 [Populus alba x Populus x berolinensis]|nr:hypothetical protein NC652_000019 [Populus alba x Populus x berolinensis]
MEAVVVFLLLIALVIPRRRKSVMRKDDDRNHKHRRRETRSQSLERDSLEPVSTRPYRKHNKHFENGHPFRENESQARETWKNYNSVSLEKDFATKFERIRPDLMGRGRESGSWSQRDSRFSSVGIASQMAHLGPNLFAGRGLANVSNVQSASWNAFWFNAKNVKMVAWMHSIPLGCKERSDQQ